MVNVFVPFDYVKAISKKLDDKRLYKQIVECKQILRALRGEVKGYANHPATKMWRGSEMFLRYYQLVLLNEWLNRRWGVDIDEEALKVAALCSPPNWWGDKEVHDSHKARLHQKDPIHYAQFKEYDKGQDYKWVTNE